MDPSEGSIPLISVFRIREFFYARILTLIQVTLLCGVTIGVLDPDWIYYSSFRSETPVLNPCVSHIFHLSLGSVNFLWILKALTFFFLDPHLYSRGSAPFPTTKISICFINTFTMCHSTRSRRRRRAATPATTPTRPTWRRRGRRRRTTPSRPTRTRWIRTRPSSRRGPPRLQSLDASLVPWYATPFRLKNSSPS